MLVWWLCFHFVWGSLIPCLGTVAICSQQPQLPFLFRVLCLCTVKQRKHCDRVFFVDIKHYGSIYKVLAAGCAMDPCVYGIREGEERLSVVHWCWSRDCPVPFQTRNKKEIMQEKREKREKKGSGKKKCELSCQNRLSTDDCDNDISTLIILHKARWVLRILEDTLKNSFVVCVDARSAWTLGCRMLIYIFAVCVEGASACCAPDMHMITTNTLKEVKI